MCFLPQMERVVHGTEPTMGVDAPAGLKLWDCTEAAAQAFCTLLGMLGLYMLAFEARQGAMARGRGLQDGLSQFKYPQVSHSSDNIDDTLCHMPSHTSFPSGSPFFRSCTHGKWYTRVRLGKDKVGKEVIVSAHVLIAAARFGVPDKLLSKRLSKAKRPLSLHYACCPGYRGGCNNPLHLHFGSYSENRLDQEDRASLAHMHFLSQVDSPCSSSCSDPCSPPPQPCKRVTRSCSHL